MSVRNLSFMMQPASIALVVAEGGSFDLGRVVFRNLLEGGFRGEITVVGAWPGSMEGVTICPTVESLPRPPDLAVVMADPDSIPAHLASLGALGARGAVVITGESGGTGSEEAQRLRSLVQEAARPFPMRVVGLNSIGIMVPSASVNASLAHVQPLKGKLAFVTRSGAVLSTVLDWATERRIGFSHLVSLGTMVDVDFGDMLDYLAEDMNTQAILLYLESVTQVRKFMSAARLASRMKPVIVLKGGRHAELAQASRRLSENTSTASFRRTPESREVQVSWIPASAGMTNASETDIPGQPPGGGAAASLLGSDAAYDAAFRRAGMLRVYDLRELFDAFETLAGVRSITGDRLAVLTNGRGMGVLAADAVGSERGRLAEISPDDLDRLNGLIPGGWRGGNPVDIQRDASGIRYARALEFLLDDRGVDAVLVLHCPSAEAAGAEVAQAVIEAMKKGGARPKANRVFTCWLGDRTAAAARRLFAESGIPTYETPNDAVRGFMQVVRYRRNQEMLMETPPSIPETFSPDCARVQQLVDQAFREGRTRLTEVESKDVLAAYGIPVQGTANGEEIHELMIGVLMDAQFGPVIRFGRGGAASELAHDAALGLPPLNLHLARELMTRAPIYRLLEGMGQGSAPNIDRIALVLVKVSQLICDIDRITEIEINPLMADGQAVLAVRASIRVAETESPGIERLAIRPYPKELEETIALPDGKTLLLRPIRPEDEPAYQRLFDGLPPEDIFLRFMNPMKTLSHNLAARLTQLDYDREMALVLMAERSAGVPELCGGVRITADSDNDRAEFAILLRRDMTGLGLGPLMMRRIIRYARSRGIREVYGEVLSENTPMLKLCRTLGFSTKRMAEDPNIIIASLLL